MDIFAGSLPFKLKEEDLKQLFEQYGEVTSAKIIIDKITRQNKGFGFIEMPNEEEAKKAIEALNGFEILGRQIVVNKSEKDKKDAPRNTERKNNFSNQKGGSGSGGFGGNKNDNYKNKGGGSFNKNRNDGFNRDRRDKYRGEDND
jgi:RNA recognition motif-containing protein